MDIMPQQDDEQPDRSQFPPPQLRHQVNQERGRFHSDEHPEIPKIRRASRHIDLDQLDTRPPVRLVRPRRQATSSTRLAIPQIGGQGEPKKEASPSIELPHEQPSVSVRLVRPISIEEDVPTHPIASSMTRNSVYPERRISKPRPYVARRKPAQRTLVGLLQELSHNTALRTIAFTLIIAVIVLPIATNIINTTILHPRSTVMGAGNIPEQSNSTSDGQPELLPHQLVITPPGHGHPAPPVFATSAYLLDADTGATYYARNPFTHLPMLSTTKLMTAMLAVETGNLDQQVTISPAIQRDIDKLSADSALMGIKQGETYSLRDLLHGLLLVSGNDAAVAIADTLGGNIPNFVAKMNQRAAKLGLRDTHYQNPHGLLMQGQYSSARDLALLGKYSLGNPTIHQISTTKEYNLPKTAQHQEKYLVNGNQFMWWYPGVDGGKTGWDGAKNFIQVVSVVRNNHHIIGVTMHTIDWWTDMRNLMNYGFGNYSWVSPYDSDITNPPIPFDYAWNYFVNDKRENTIPTADKGRYYNFTGYSVYLPILDYFEKNGGLKRFGYPTGQSQLARDNTNSQQFERAIIRCNMASRQCSG